LNDVETVFKRLFHTLVHDKIGFIHYSLTFNSLLVTLYSLLFSLFLHSQFSIFPFQLISLPVILNVVKYPFKYLHTILTDSSLRVGMAGIELKVNSEKLKHDMYK